jgi:hypothetical protein
MTSYPDAHRLHWLAPHDRQFSEHSLQVPDSISNENPSMHLLQPVALQEAQLASSQAVQVPSAMDP